MVDFFSNVFVSFLVLALGCLVFHGAAKMKSLESYGWAMAACILAMLPCSLCCILGLPFGIWGLLVINRSDVNNAFHAMPDHYR